MTTLSADSRSSDGRRGALTVRGVTKRFDSVVAVDDVSFDLPAGAFFSLLGPSGCGKTTLLRIIGGLETPDAGGVEVDGEDITKRPPEQRPFNTVFQRYALFPHLNVFDNVAFGLTTDRRNRPSKSEIAGRVGEVLRLVDLDGFDRRMPNQLSGGQAQRVSVARALIRRPRVLLLDEPMAALDRNVRHQVREELLRIHTETGTTFLMVTHDQEEALSISQLVAIMNRGRLEQIADPETLYHRPATLFAARFVGAGCFLSGTAVRVNDHDADVDVQGIRYLAANAGVTENDRVELLLRPEDLNLEAPGDGRIDGSVKTCSFFGSYYELTVETPIALFRLRHARSHPTGESVAVQWPNPAGIAYPSAPPVPEPAGGDDASERAVRAERAVI